MSIYGYLCGTPDEYCTGGKLSTDQSLGHKKYHGDRKGAFKCHVRYLLSLGFVQNAPREFVNPVNGYIRVLSKKSKFGGVLRYGKELQRGMPLETTKGSCARGMVY